jgi:hypothetical protein
MMMQGIKPGVSETDTKQLPVEVPGIEVERVEIEIEQLRVEVPGIEPGSFDTDTGLLRA